MCDYCTGVHISSESTHNVFEGPSIRCLLCVITFRTELKLEFSGIRATRGYVEIK